MTTKAEESPKETADVACLSVCPIPVVKDIPVTWQDVGIYEGWLPVECMEIATPTLNFKGTGIPRPLWQQLAAFFRWTYDEFHSEAQVRLHYRDTDGTWAIVVLPQEVSGGMFSRELEHHKDKEKALQCIAQGYLPIGTVHHHCSGSAFQSGTDHGDEVRQNGLHITLGNVDEKVWDLHARATFKKAEYEVDLKQWFAFNVREATHDLDLKADFPAEWKDRMIHKEVTEAARWSPTYGYGAYGTPRAWRVSEWNPSPATSARGRDMDDIREVYDTIFYRSTKATDTKSTKPIVLRVLEAYGKFSRFAESIGMRPDELADIMSELGACGPLRKLHYKALNAWHRGWSVDAPSRVADANDPSGMPWWERDGD